MFKLNHQRCHLSKYTSDFSIAVTRMNMTVRIVSMAAYLFTFSFAIQNVYASADNPINLVVRGTEHGGGGDGAIEVKIGANEIRGFLKNPIARSYAEGIIYALVSNRNVDCDDGDHGKCPAPRLVDQAALRIHRYGQEKIGDLARNAEFRLEEQQPCFDPNEKLTPPNMKPTPKDAAVISKSPAVICFSIPRLEARQYTNLTAPGHIIGLIAHELSHFADTTEDEAKEFQTAATEYKNTLPDDVDPLALKYRAFIGLKTAKDYVNGSISDLSDYLDRPDTTICVQLGERIRFAESAFENAIFGTEANRRMLLFPLYRGMGLYNPKFMTVRAYIGNFCFIETIKFESTAQNNPEVVREYRLVSAPRDRVALEANLNALLHLIEETLEVVNSSKMAGICGYSVAHLGAIACN
jgi:hypothetical protein